jgi:hypothetical protein
MFGFGPSDWWSVSPMDFLLMGLATWRLASLLIDEDGPWDIFARLRYKAGVRYDEHSVPYGQNVLASLLTCMWCGSVWVGGAMAVAYLTVGSLTTLLCLPLALSAAAIVLSRMVRHE